MSASYPGDVLPLWNPEIPGEEVQAGRLGIRVRPGSPAAAKLAFIPGGTQWLRDVLQEQEQIDGYYSIVKPNKPIEFVGQVDHTLITGRLGRTISGLALEITDMQQLESEYEVEKARLRLRFRELQLVEEWGGDLEGFTALELREQVREAPILDSTMRFIVHLRDYREKLAEGAIRRYEAVEQWVECPRCETVSATSNGVLSCPECGDDLRGGEFVRAALDIIDGDARVYRGIDSLTVRSPGFPEYRGMTLDRVQGRTLWVSFRRYDPLPDEGVILPTASVEMFDAQKSVIRQLQIGSPRTGALGGMLADPGWLGSPPQARLDGRPAHHLPDPNEEQAEAVARVMGMRPGQLYLIQGPPGTGKTTAIVESIRRILGRNHSATILLSSHSNDAVDTGQERLLGFSHVRQARIAEPGKVPRRLRHTLVEGDDLDPFNLVAGTCNRLAIDSRLRFRVFDWLILDEANKVRSNEALALMPLAKRWVFIGDVNQLPPVMEDAAMSFEIQSELDQVVRDDSFYGWVWDQVPQSSKIMLPRQYRMREPIGKIVSDLFYGGRLIHEAPAEKMPLPWPFDREVVWVDTGAQDEYRDAQKSVANEFEVALCKDITTIIRKRVRKAKVAVIAMYSSQVNRLVTALRGIVPPDDIESVDAFEGRESDVVILSLVRSNERAAIGFLNDPNRVNVAISRARKLLVIVGDSKTVIGGAPELFGPLAQHAKDDGLIAGVGAVVTACQRVGIRSQVQKLSRPKRSKRKRKKRREPVAAGAAVAIPMGPDEALEQIEVEIGRDPLAAREPDRPQPRSARRRRTRRPAAPVAAVAQGATPPPEEAAPSSRRRRTRRGATAPAVTEAATVEASERDTPPQSVTDVAPPAEDVAPAPRRTAAAAATEAPAPVEEAAPAPAQSVADVAPPVAEEAAPAPRRRTRRTAAPAATEAPAPVEEAAPAPAQSVADVAPPVAEEAAPAPRRRTRRTAAPAATEAPAPVEEVAPAPAQIAAGVSPPAVEEAPAAPRRRTRRVAEPVVEAAAAPANETPAPAPRKRSARKPAAEPAEATPVAEETTAPVAESAPASRRRTSRKASQPTEVAAVEQAPPAPRRRSRAAAEPAAEAAPPAEEAPPAPRRRTPKAAAATTPETGVDAPVRRRSTSRKPANGSKPEGEGTAATTTRRKRSAIGEPILQLADPDETAPRTRGRARTLQADLPLDLSGGD